MEQVCSQPRQQAPGLAALNMLLSGRQVSEGQGEVCEHLESEEAHPAWELEEDAVLHSVAPHLGVQHGDQAGQWGGATADTGTHRYSQVHTQVQTHSGTHTHTQVLSLTHTGTQSGTHTGTHMDVHRMKTVKSMSVHEAVSFTL